MDKNSSVYKTILLAVVCAIAGVLLSAVNSLTAPVIAENALATVRASLEEIYPDVDDFEDVTEKNIKDDDSGMIEGIYRAGDKGYIFKLHNVGYESDGFTFMIGFNMDGTISGYKVLSQKETAGKGDLAFKDDYTAQVLKLTSKDDMPIISGATVTSSAVGEAVKAAEAIFNSIAGIK